MHLEGQYERRARPDAGYAMAVLLAGIAIMGVVWTLVVPVWKQQIQREKEAELIFRAGQYARAVALYQRKYANAFPPNVEVLLKEKFLRKKYKDPVTNREFRYLSPLELQAQPGMTTTTPAPGNRGTNPTNPPPNPLNGGIGGSNGSTSSFGAPNALGPNGPTAGPQAGIAAVVSRSSAASIKIFKNRRQYNQWIVTVQDVMPRSAVGTPQPGQSNQPGQMTPSGGPSGLSPGGSTFPTGPR
jgi:type II secretory pathway pseudopilin PulG